MRKGNSYGLQRIRTLARQDLAAGMVSRMLNSLYERHLTLLSVEMLNDD